MPSRALPSAEQWNMEVYAALPSINWNVGNQGLVILDNDDVWVWFERFQDHVADFESRMFSFGKVSPSGYTQYTADHWGAVSQLTGSGAYFRGPFQDQFIYQDPIFWESEPSWVISDGKLIWIYIGETNTVWEFNPDTLFMTHVAGVKDIDSGSHVNINSHDGLAAYFDDVNMPTVHDGWAYWAEPTPSGFGHITLRRMKLSDSYTVERWGGLADNPISNTSLAWQGQINSSTGLPNAISTNAVFGSYQKIGFWDGYVYLMGEWSGSGGLGGWALRRVQLDSPDTVDVLYYGLTSPTNDPDVPPTFSDDNHLYSSWPEGAWSGSFWNHRIPFRGTYEREGFDVLDQTNGIMLSDGRWIMENYAASSLVGGYLLLGGEVVAFDLPAIVEEFIQDGPIKHNPDDARWSVIANASHADETVHSVNVNVRDRGWNFRAGSKPIFSHPFPPGWGYNSNSSFGESIMFITSVAASITDWTNVVGPQTGLIVTLNESSFSTGSRFGVNLIFEGETLKGYSDVYDINAPFAQEQVILE